MSPNRFKQHGSTLVVSLIMLIVLTLLVVSSIRTGNSNLRIAGNMQQQAEASMATQQAIEQIIDKNNATPFTSLTTPQTVAVDMGAVSYNVAVPKPTCLNTSPVDPSTLDPTDPKDRTCFGDSANAGDLPVLSTGNQMKLEAACNNQQWEVQASVTDPNGGAKVETHQGLTKRFNEPTNC
jgi:hypothetical protein